MLSPCVCRDSVRRLERKDIPWQVELAMRDCLIETGLRKAIGLAQTENRRHRLDGRYLSSIRRAFLAYAQKTTQIDGLRTPSPPCCRAFQPGSALRRCAFEPNFRGRS